ncbi:DUF4127 family protein [Paenibacillus sp. MBLB4367]|uniref:DUF4127 family protein n=1 Tax=Paenibacillus sp. MBLB4367 TaxID=3384767 RepID=UPI0039081D89
MTQIVYLPLDERPCNLQYPQHLADMTDLQLSVPDTALLGDKKKPADVPALHAWLRNAVTGADYLIASIDMLIYGGIVPSRLHALTFEECVERLDLLRAIKAQYPGIRIHAFNLIMRVPSMSTSEEEPDYYADYGSDIFKYGWLTDKAERGELAGEDQAELDALIRHIPEDVLNDFVSRRAVNAKVNRYVIALMEEGVIDNLIIPLDDNSQYGFSPKEQRALIVSVQEANLFDRIMIYPGADEIGCILFTKVFCEVKQYIPEVFVRYSSTTGPLMKPKYEDRSLQESIKSHLTAAGAVMADNSVETDVVLMVNAPPAEQRLMSEQGPFANRSRAYFSEIHYREFSEAIKHYLRKGKLVGLGDVAICNGSDVVLLNLLGKLGLLDQLTAYAGWNTSGNTLGTVISHLIVVSYYERHAEEADKAKAHAVSRAYYYKRLIEDWGYMSIIRQETVREVLPALGASYYNLYHVREELYRILTDKLNTFAAEKIGAVREGTLTVENVFLPWKRMFEVGFDVKIGQ